MSASNELEPDPSRFDKERSVGAGLEKGDWATSREAQSLPLAVGWGGFTPG
jgi:hypothetical protein